VVARAEKRMSEIVYQAGALSSTDHLPAIRDRYISSPRTTADASIYRVNHRDESMKHLHDKHRANEGVLRY
jgi:hypothetical protein